jgi:hypothetical protein
VPPSQTTRTAEQWALRAVDAHLRGLGAEDSRVEFKRQLPDDPQKVARRLAGHANAARGEPILWVVGIDEAERRLVPAVLPSDPATYWSKVWSKFDGPHPDLVDVHVDFDGVPLLALAFNCDRVPYVIHTGLNAPRLEVPWREGTRVESATRSQLIRMTQPLAMAPSVEVRSMAVDPGAIAVFFFVVPVTSEPIMLPLHKAILEYGPGRLPAEEVAGNHSRLVGTHPVLREAKGQGVYFYGPAEIVVRWRLGTSQPPQQCSARLTFEPGGIEVLVTDGMPLR